MSFSFSALICVLSLMTFPPDIRVSGCDRSCTDKPVFSPNQLVVKYGDPASAYCSACQRECIGNIFDIEKAVGEVEKNGTVLYWKTDNVDQWDLTLTCYYSNASDYQCCTDLPVTVYKPPDRVSFSFGDHTGPLIVGNMYTLRCTLENVAPIGKVEAVFYKGDFPFAPVGTNNTEDKKPVTQSLELDIIPLDGDNGAEYWCQAKFKLGSEGQQRLPVVKSQRITAVVYYKPRFQVTHDSTLLTITEGEKLQLNCTSVGNPSPSYNWTLPLGSLSPDRSSVLTIESVAAEHTGKYTCIVSNGYWTISEEFTVDVRPNYIIHIIIGILVLAVLLVLIMVVVYYRCYRPKRIGNYNLLDVLRLRTRHTAVPCAE